mgnify:CR=1 FL=1|jgi:hypothetical protein
MEQYNNNSLYGVPKGLSVGQFERTNELNCRIANRHFSDKTLAANFDPRPVSTRYAVLPILERRAVSMIEIDKVIEHSVSNNFNPGTQRGPPDTFFTNIDTDSVLRNLTTSIQKGAHQAIYVPSSTSDMYRIEVPTNDRIPTHPGLFSDSILQSSRGMHYSHNVVGNNAFLNSTRVQMRHIS